MAPISRHVLSVSVSNRFTAFAAGLGVTGLVQSSNATAASSSSSFVGRGLIAVAPALAIMLGANVGTAPAIVQVFSMGLSWLSPLLIIVGVILHLSWKGSRPGHVGQVLIGLGLITLALELISDRHAPRGAGRRREGAVQHADRRCRARHADWRMP